MKRAAKVNMIQTQKSDLVETLVATNSVQQQQVEGQNPESLTSSTATAAAVVTAAEFRRPAIPPAKSAQHQVTQPESGQSYKIELL